MSLFSFGNDSACLVGNLSEYEGTRCLDIRNWYRDKKTGELRPTTKGVALGRAKFKAVSEALRTHELEITKWLVGGTLPSAEKGLVDRSQNPTSTVILTGNLPAHLMMDLETRGGSQVLILNRDTSLGLMLSESLMLPKAARTTAGDHEISALLFRLVVSVQQALNAVGLEDNERSPSSFVADFEIEWKKAFDNGSW